MPKPSHSSARTAAAGSTAIFGYGRVSTAEQTTENQRVELLEAGYAVRPAHWFADTGISGKTPAASRPQFARLLEKIRDGIRRRASTRQDGSNVRGGQVDPQGSSSRCRDGAGSIDRANPSGVGARQGRGEGAGTARQDHGGPTHRHPGGAGRWRVGKRPRTAVRRESSHHHRGAGRGLGGPLEHATTA